METEAFRIRSHDWFVSFVIWTRTARTYNLEIVRTLELSDVSGAAVLLTPEMRELVALIGDPAIEGVVCREFSRLMRPENLSDSTFLHASHKRVAHSFCRMAL